MPSRVEEESRRKIACKRVAPQCGETSGLRHSIVAETSIGHSAGPAVSRRMALQCGRMTPELHPRPLVSKLPFLIDRLLSPCYQKGLESISPNDEIRSGQPCAHLSADRPRRVILPPILARLRRTILTAQELVTAYAEGDRSQNC